ncbi:MAG: hypothetical protein U0800_20930 [Isosphaeraceae bacterium]
MGIGGRFARLKGVDWPSASMALVAAVALAWVAWDRFVPKPMGPPLLVGSPAPPLPLNDPDTGESATIWNRPRHILWVAFWSPDGPNAGAELEAIDRVWRRLQGRDPFAMVVAVVDGGRKVEWRKAFRDKSADLPVLLANEPSRRAFGVRTAPMHFLIDDHGLVVATAGGLDRPTPLESLAEQAEHLLDEIAPVDRRLAARSSPPASRRSGLAGITSLIPAPQSIVRR